MSGERMIERVARAMRDKEWGDGGPPYGGPEGEGTKDYFDGLARAAIEATAVNELVEQAEQSALTLEEVAKVLRGAGLAGTASICDSLAKRQRAFLSDNGERK